ncbi:MAG TPA: hypothetical protein VKQ36_15865, partial [Ktedonobacterales bacterium]|nr:hypothetical protein [Ktedonobacterales bacterium]
MGKRIDNEKPTLPALTWMARYEVILAYVSLALGVAAMAYLLISGIVAHEACYGVSLAHIQ